MVKRVALIADEDPRVAKLLGFTLSRADFTCTYAARAQEAIDQAQAILPDLVLLDTGLSDGDAFAVCRRLRQDPATGGTAVIILTTYLDEHVRHRSAEAGAAAVVVKPFSPRAVLALASGLVSGAPVGV